MVGIFTVKMRGGHIYGNYCTQNRERRGNCDFVLSIKLAVETPMLLRDQLLDLFTTSQVVKQSGNYANYPNLLASDFNTHQ